MRSQANLSSKEGNPRSTVWPFFPAQVDIGQTLLSLVLVPPAFYTNNQFSALLRALSGYGDVACTKVRTAQSAHSLYLLSCPA